MSNAVNITNNKLVEGLVIVFDKLSKMRDKEKMFDYLSFGNDEYIDVKEEIARLTLIATTLPTSDSPIENIVDKLYSKRPMDINSMFVKEFLEMRERNKNTAFMRSAFYNNICLKVEEMELKSAGNNLYLSNGIVLSKDLKKLYISNLDNNISDNKLDIKYREPLIELFQHNLDCTLEKLRNGEKKNVQVQREY